MSHLAQTFIKIQNNFQSYTKVICLCRRIETSHSPTHNDVCLPSYFSSEDDKTLQVIHEHFKLYEHFITEEEEKGLMQEIDPILKRRRYEKDHWDDDTSLPEYHRGLFFLQLLMGCKEKTGQYTKKILLPKAIKGYKETEKTQWNESNSDILERLRNLAFTKKSSLIRSVHVLDLSKEGYIKPHIDSIRFCGDTIAGLSLLSASVMRLAMEENKNMFVDILLPRRSLYIMKGIARYKFTHEILEEGASFFKGRHIMRDRRISVICRNEPLENLQ